MAADCRSVACYADERQLADVKSCGPDLPVPRSSRRQRFTRCADDGGNQAGPRGEHEVSVKTVAQGMPDDRQHLWYLPPAFFSQAGHG